MIPTIGVPMVASDAIRSMRASSSKLATPARSQVAAARSRLPKASTAPRLIAKTVLGYLRRHHLDLARRPTPARGDLVTSAAIEHTLMGLTALGAVAVSVASWIGR